MDIRKNQRNTVLRVVLFLGAFWLLLFGLRSIPISIPPALGNLVFGIMGSVGAVLLVKAFLKSESNTLSDVGLALVSGSLRRFILGSIVGLALAGIMLAAAIGMSGLVVESVPNPDYWDAIAFSMAVLFVLALMEEVAFRSYPLVRLLNSIGPRTSIYCTSFFFALYHGLQPAQLLGPGVWGVLFGVAALASRGIALPLGIHFGLNWMQSLFGMKTQFATSIWTIVPATEEGIVSTNVIGVALQLILLAVGIALVELYIRKKSEPTEVIEYDNIE